jgi:iron complex outermembrane recepter protein
MKKTLALASLLTLFTTQNSIAKSGAVNTDLVEKNNNTTEEQYQLCDTDIFSLSKKNEDAFDAASSIYVLSSDDIRRSGATSIPEALRLVPGLQVAKIDGHKWAISARGFNQQFSNKLLVMIDGRTIYTPLFSGVVWDVQDYVLEDIEKIEVIRGSGGAIWGANAVNGIINIITKNAVDTQGGYASAIVGNEDRVIAEVRYGGRTKSLNHYRVYAKQVNHDGLNKINTDTSNDDGYRQSQAGFRYDIRSIENNTISIHGDIRDGKADSYFDLRSAIGIGANGVTNKNSKGANLVVNWDRTISKKSSFTLQTYLDYDQFDTFVLERDGRTADVDFQYFYDLNRQNQITGGLSYRLITDKINENPLTNGLIPLNYTPNKRTDQIFSTFLQDKISLVPDVFYLTVGSKFEINDYTGFEIQPSAKLTLFPSRNQTIWASVSRAVRTPTRGESDLNLLGGNQKGSSNYEAENIIAYEAGYRIKPSRNSLIDIATFYNEYNNLRTFECDNVSCSLSTIGNLGKGKSFGAEITAKLQAMDNWRLEAGYDFLKIDLKTKIGSNDRSATARLTNVEGQSPEGQFRLRSNFNITPKIEFDNIFYYVDALPLSGSTNGVNGVPSYFRLDTRVGYLVNSNIDLSVGVQNITDKRHQEFDKGLAANETEVGRTVYFKTVVRF